MPRVFTPLYNISDTNIKKIISTDPFEVILRLQIILSIYNIYNIWIKLFKNGPSKICVRKPLKNLQWNGLLKAVFHKNLLDPFLNTMTLMWMIKKTVVRGMSHTKHWIVVRDIISKKWMNLASKLYMVTVTSIKSFYKKNKHHFLLNLLFLTAQEIQRQNVLRGKFLPDV